MGAFYIDYCEPQADSNGYLPAAHFKDFNEIAIVSFQSKFKVKVILLMFNETGYLKTIQ